MSSQLEKDIEYLEKRGHVIDRENISGKITVDGKPHDIENNPWSSGPRIKGIERRFGEPSED